MAEFLEQALVVAEYQLVPCRTVPEVVMNTFFFAQPLNQVQVIFVVLHAVITLRARLVELEAVGVAEDAVFFEDLRDDLRGRHLLEDARVAAQFQVLQLRHQGHAVAVQALAGLALSDR